ncbi:uncharacterized protein LOC144138254 isoform X2 [Haemaphysalis longicornis]
MNAHLTLRKMSNRTSSGGRNVKLLQDMCLDTLSVRAVLDCFCNISLPPRLADYYYERVRKQHGITDEVLPVNRRASLMLPSGDVKKNPG